MACVHSIALAISLFFEKAVFRPVFSFFRNNFDPVRLQMHVDPTLLYNLRSPDKPSLSVSLLVLIFGYFLVILGQNGPNEANFGPLKKSRKIVEVWSLVYQNIYTDTIPRVIFGNPGWPFSRLYTCDKNWFRSKKAGFLGFGHFWVQLLPSCLGGGTFAQTTPHLACRPCPGRKHIRP